jgi:hypothetical protein
MSHSDIQLLLAQHLRASLPFTIEELGEVCPGSSHRNLQNSQNQEKASMHDVSLWGPCPRRHVRASAWTEYSQ